MLMSLGACHSEQSREPKAKPNIILISIDTLRADHLGCYGYERKTSPHIDAFAESGLIFRNARSHSNWTAPSHMSMFTGLFPSVHGIWEYSDPGTLAPEIPTFPEILQANGYATGAYTGGGYVSARYGFDRGFDIYRSEGMFTRNFDRAMRFARKWISTQLKKQQPYFLFLHTYQVHEPYNPPDAYKGFAAEYTPIDKLNADDRWSKATIENWPRWIADAASDSKFLPTVIGLYDGEIRSVDDGLGRLFEFLKSKNAFENTLIVITSDHGEAFLEHAEFPFGHHSLFDEILRVPLIMHTPSSLGLAAATSLTTNVGHVDLAPTMLAVAGIEVPSGTFQGRSLLSDVKAAKATTVKPQDFFAERAADRHPAPSWIVGGDAQKKCSVRNPDTSPVDAYFDLLNDPMEAHDLAPDPARSDELSRCRDALLKRRADNLDVAASTGRPVETPEMSEEEKAQLRALGYAP
jgi:arylsulfatase A-like enzyme